MVQFDHAIISIALPSIQRSLGLDIGGLQWIVNSYNLGFAGLLLLSGRLSDLFGRREVFLAGLWLFTFGSVLGGFAQEGWQLVAARAAHGVSSAILVPSTLGLILAAYQDKFQRNRAISVWGAASIIGGTLGAVLSGVLTEHWGWRSTFFFCLPIGCVLLYFGTRKLARQTVLRVGMPSLDIPGTICVVGSVTSLVYATIGLRKHSWRSGHTLLWFGIAAAFLIAFVLIERRTRDPLVPLDIFRSRWISMGNVLTLIIQSAISAQVFIIVLYLQIVLRYGPQKAGFAELPSGLTTFLVALLAARLVKRTGVRLLLIVASVVYAVSLVWMARVPVHGSYISAVFLPLELSGIGMGLVIPCLTIAATAGAPKHTAGLVSGVATTTRQIGSAIGVAAFGSVAGMVAAQHATGNPLVAMTDGYRTALLAAAGVTIVGALLAFALPKDRLQPAVEAPAE